MPFKSHLAVLVLMLCGLHLTGRADSHTVTTIIQVISRDKAVQSDTKSLIQLPDTNKIILDSQPNKDKADQTTVTHTTPAAKEGKSATSTTHHSTKDLTASTTHHSTNDLTASTTHHSANDLTASTTHHSANDLTASTTHHSANDLTASTTHHSANDKTQRTTEPSKTSAPKKEAIHRNGGSSATIPSMFTIASLICVLLL